MPDHVNSQNLLLFSVTLEFSMFVFFFFWGGLVVKQVFAHLKKASENLVQRKL